MQQVRSSEEELLTAMRGSIATTCVLPTPGRTNIGVLNTRESLLRVETVTWRA
jgi:hypothetical protein